MTMAIVRKQERGWPSDAESLYEPIRPIGRGAYGSVWVAKKRSSAEEECKQCSTNDLVAMKVISTSGTNGKAFADREIALLRKIDHPNVIKLIQSFSGFEGGRLVVLSLIRGPTIREILDARGAVGLPAARLISRHAVAALSYLHCRAVMHRDLKPENLVLEMKNAIPDASSWNGWKKNDVIFDDDESAEQVMTGWKVVLSDLGFAKEMSPHELNIDDFNKCTYDDLSHSRTSRVLLRSMSALGSRSYASPELLPTRPKLDDGEALTEFVADYTFLADEYALGVTMREILTGVPACERDINEYVKMKRLENYLTGGRSKMRYRQISEVPRRACELIRDLTWPLAEERITCLVAQLYPYINGGQDGEPVYTMPDGTPLPGDNIAFFNSAQQQQDSETATETQGRTQPRSSEERRTSEEVTETREELDDKGIISIQIV